jgi:glycosyltransferase involved in cell wall biosynthesis
MNSPPLFSIITAVKDGLLELKTTYRSLLSQSNQNFEWIVIDACSTDGTADWLANLSDFGERLRWISEADKGISDAWNKGIDRANGQQILFLNAGDVYDQQMIERFSDAVGSDYITCCHTRLLSSEGRSIGLFKAYPEKLWRGMHLPHNWCSVPRDMYEQYGGYKLMRYSMDFEWFHRYYKTRGSSGFRILDVALGSYCMGGHSDVYYKEGFTTNAAILVENGMPRIFATLLCMAYTFNHRSLNRSVKNQGIQQ